MSAITFVVCDQCGDHAEEDSRYVLGHWGESDDGADLCPACAPCWCTQHARAEREDQQAEAEG